MQLNPGTRLGPYEVVAPLGAGGMGEVYRAKDTRLGREVAIKVLPAGFAEDPERRARFEREAQAVAALSHPNIVAIHDTGLHDNQLFVVMELLTGETLRERLRAGAMPVRKAIEVAVQIARGLGAAHGKGLVHRDLKPDNVFVQEDGQVKILDFGLARQTGVGQSGAAETMAATDPGIVMGTIGYMAPEQVRGQAVDARADVFAFGAVLYEMVSGTRAFQGETAADTMTAILTKDPPELSGTRPDLSPALDRIVRHCLEKNPNERFQSARDVAFALEALSGTSPSGVTGATAAVAAAPGSRAERRGLSPLLVAALLVAAAGAGVLATKFLATPRDESLRFVVKTFEPQAIFNARYMPDGETIVFSSATRGNAPHLYEIRPGTVEARPIGPPNTHLLSVSAKGELAVITDAVYLNHRLFRGTLSRMTLEGAPKPWLERVRDADWAPAGDVLALIRDENGRDQLEYPIGTVLYQASGYLSDVRISPDGSRVAFMEHPQRFDDRGFVRVIDRAKNVVTVGGEFWGEEGIAWSPDGATLMFAASSSSTDGRGPGDLSYQIYRVTPDGRTPAKFALSSPGNFTILDLSKTGRWLATRDDFRYGFVAKGAAQPREQDLSWLDKCWGVTLSRDGQRVFFGDGNFGPDYGVAWRKTDGSPVVHLGDGDFIAESPDGKFVLGTITSKNQLVLYPMGAGETRKLNTRPLQRVEGAAWFPDSQHLLIGGSEAGQATRLYKLSINGGAPEPFLDGVNSEMTFLLDGQHAIARKADGQPWVYALKDGSSVPLKGVTADDAIVSLVTDGRSILVQRERGTPIKVERVDLATGARTPFKEFGPQDQSGLLRLGLATPYMPPDASAYAYSYYKKLSTLFTGTPSK